jgi:hypothetical protein
MHDQRIVEISVLPMMSVARETCSLALCSRPEEGPKA